MISTLQQAEDHWAGKVLLNELEAVSLVESRESCLLQVQAWGVFCREPLPPIGDFTRLFFLGLQQIRNQNLFTEGGKQAQQHFHSLKM